VGSKSSAAWATRFPRALRLGLPATTAIRSPSTNPKLRFKRFEHHLTTARLDLAPTPL